MASWLHQEVTDKIVAALEAGAPPWIQPWSTTPGRNTPCNAVTNRPYSGINMLLLWQTRAMGWQAPCFLTFRQALAVGGHVRKGERGSRVVFVKDLPAKKMAEGDEDEHTTRMLKQFIVFNVAQCDGLPEKITNPPPLKIRHHDGHDPLIDAFITTTAADVREGHDRACFIHAKDIIAMPAFVSFASATLFYNTLFHELIHWTGHKARLDRNLGERFSTAAYAAEELIAELGAAFLCAEWSIDGDLRHAGYIEHWIQLLKSDSRAIFACASKAQQAVDFLRDLALREQPAQAAE